MPRPNVLWICTDQQRYDTIRALGNPHVRTPHIDGLIADGVCFEQAYCQSPVCTPSRASFLTGRYARTTRCRQNGQTMPEQERLLPRLFADAGYRCGLAGKLHLSSCDNGKVEQRIDDGYEVFHWSHHPQPDWPENAYTQWLQAQGQDWDTLYADPGNGFVKAGVPAEYHQTTWCAQMAIDFIHEAQDDGRPWFFSFNCFDPHHAFDPPQTHLDRFDPATMPLPKVREGEWQQKTPYQALDHEWAHNEPGGFHTAAMTNDDRRLVTAAYYAMCELIDEQVGRMLAALAETGQLANTIVIFMSDHGEMLGDHGIYYKGPHFYDEAVRVPLVMSWPGELQAGLRQPALVELLDLAPTLLEAAGLPVPSAMQGRSLLPLCRGETTQHRDGVFSEYYNAWSHPYSYGSMWRTDTHKIVVYHGIEQGELYDLVADPDEFENLWDSPEHQVLKLRMMRACFDASIFTMDPDPPRLGAF
jgi:arylsulfatase